MSRGRWHRRKQTDSAPPVADAREGGGPQLRADELQALASAFEPRPWLRDLGFSSWYLVGFILLLVGLVWLLGATSTITGPVTVALVLAAVTSPLVAWFQRHGIGRALGAVFVLLSLVALSVLVFVLVVGGLSSQAGDISDALDSASSEVQGWLEDAGVSSSGASSAANGTKNTIESNTSDIISTLAHGVIDGIVGITSLALGLSFALLSLFFLLKDGPSLRAAVDSHLGVPVPVAQTITGDVLTALRGYFLGVTIVAAFNGIVVGLAALVLGVPLAGTIAIVTFICAYVPYIGAFVAGAFAVILALGTEGTTTAAIMLVVVLLANGSLQQILQPIAYGATLGIHPLVVLIVTIAAGSLFGMLGLVLAAPLTSAAVHISRDLGAARLSAGGGVGEPDGEPPPEASPAPA
jgi:predicted PurR-regulated permease PerM